MPPIFKLLSAPAILIGLIAAAVAVWFLWPIPTSGIAPIAAFAFLIGTGLTQLIIVLLRRSKGKTG